MTWRTLEDIPPKTDPYWTYVRAKAADLGSDACSWVPDFYRDACLEHDIHYRTHLTLWASPLTRARADRRFRRVMQSRSPFGRLSPMSWWRWGAVRLLGRRAWSRPSDAPPKKRPSGVRARRHSLPLPS